MEIAERHTHGVRVLAISGRVDGVTCNALEAALNEPSAGTGATLLDLDGVDYISSAGLRVFLKAAKQAKSRSVPLALSGLRSKVREIFDVSGFTPLFTLHADQGAGVDALATQIVPTTAAPAPAPAPAASAGVLPTLLEEVVLLCIDDASGAVRPAPRSVLDLVTAGAALMELALLGRVDSDLDGAVVVNRKPIGEPLLDDALNRLAQAGRGSLTDWAHTAAKDGPALREQALARLVERGVLRTEEGRFLWLFKERRYPAADGKEHREVRARLRDLALGEDIPDPRDAMLIGLLLACGLMDTVLTGPELRAAKPRLEQLRKLDLIGQEIDRLVLHIENVIAHAMGPI